MSRRGTLLYDGDCGFCRWSIAWVLRRDRQEILHPLAIQSPEGGQLLARLPEADRLESWHLVLDGGRVLSGGAAFAPLLELLGRPAPARLLARVPRLTEWAYRGITGRRGTLGAIVTRSAKRRADELISQRAGAEPPGGAAAGPPDDPATQGEPPPDDPATHGQPPPDDPGTHGQPPPDDRGTRGEPAPERHGEPAGARGGEPVPGPAFASAFASASAPAPGPASAAARAPDPTPAGAARASAIGWQQRLEESAFGRGLLSTLIVATLIAIVAINLPASDLRRQLLRAGQPYLNAIGADQNWALFAPDPRRVVIDVWATVTFDDGATARWSFPHDDPVVGAYRDYRWRKWEENLINPSNGGALWRSAALWAAGSESRPGHAATNVALVERYAALAPPGTSPSVGPAGERVFYVLRLRPAGVAQ